MKHAADSTTEQRRAGRRGFLRTVGAGAAGTALFAAGCDTGDPTGGDPPEVDVTLDFSVETDVLNYAYALEQLEAGFYAGVAAAIDSDGLFGDDAVTANYFVDLAEHEAIHRDFLAAALGDAGLMVQASFADFDFTDEALVLGTSQQLEDTGVSAYNGAGQYLTTDDFLTIAGKIVSVEARHASAIRSIIGGNQNFADMSDEFLVNLGSSSAFALDAAADPQTVLDVVAGTGFVSTTFSVVNT